MKRGPSASLGVRSHVNEGNLCSGLVDNVVVLLVLLCSQHFKSCLNCTLERFMGLVVHPGPKQTNISILSYYYYLKDKFCLFGK